MKKFKLLFTILFATVLSSIAQSQISIRAGYNLSKVAKVINLQDDCEKFDWKSAANFGVTIDFEKSEKFAFRPGIYYSMKGFKADEVMPKVNLNYLEMPLLAVFKIGLTENSKLEFQIGPYLAYGICGKYKYETSVTPKNNRFESEYTTYKSFSGEDSYKRFDLGINSGLGVSYKNYYLGASYELGTTYIMNKSPNHCLSINVGYTF